MGDLNFHHLRYFWLVATDSSLTAAARRLRVSQSSLSVQIKRLEEQLGHQLFVRSGRQLILTEAGRITLEFARSIFTTGDELLGTLGELGATRRRFRVGGLATLSRNFQIAFVKPLLAADNMEVEIRSGTLDELLASLRDFELDVVLANLAPTAEAGWLSYKIADQPVSLVGLAHKSDTNRELTALLTEEPLVVPASTSSIRAGFDALINRLGVQPRIVAEVDDMAMLRLVCRTHSGLSVVPPIVVKDELEAGVLHEVARLPGLRETFFAITVARRFPHPFLQELLDVAKRVDPGPLEQH